jgi:hypothetical protein
MSDTMSEEEMKDFMTSFICDKGIPRLTRFNLCQTMLKLYNAGGGNAHESDWNRSSDDHALPNVALNGVSIVSVHHLALL